VLARTYNHWLFKTSEVDIFHESTGTTTRVLGADGHFYRRQLEAFADSILNSTMVAGADIDDGLASVRGMVAIAQSVREGRPVKLAEAAGGL
jgi:predicted dehydrogenase